MSKLKWVIPFIITAGCYGMGGCAKETANSAKEKEVPKKSAEEKTKQPIIEKQREMVVKVMNPLTKTVVKTFVSKDLQLGDNYALYEDSVKKWAYTAARGDGTNPGFDQRNVPDRIDGKGAVIKGKPRTILDEEGLVQRILAASKTGGEVELPLEVSPSGYQPEEVPHLAEKVVAAYTTHFSSSVAGRTRNVELSAQAINNVIIGRQDYFSFNTTVGPSDQAHGYQPAKEAVDGKLVDGIGGGICQTSSTLYNAIDQLKVSYVEKHHHSLTVGYVPKGRDATVSYGGLDFRFQNTTGAPLLLKAYVNKARGELTVEVRTSKSSKIS
ncbi:VanW family protein [Peribacillus kribbensis]|uniref:VanW family protein n=1 Tax=Peribacillus kribbensis TaxID=356658 RepID=UPI0005538F74|nr:VanW family protein [Peribacillus kribbensis]